MAGGLAQLRQKIEAKLRTHCVGFEETLKYGEAFHLDQRSRMIRVRSGRIWLTWDGDDYVLEEGEEFFFPSGTPNAVLSTVKGDEATFEMLCVPAE